jgi:hypothetical protein
MKILRETVLGQSTPSQIILLTTLSAAEEWRVTGRHMLEAADIKSSNVDEYGTDNTS